MLVVSLEQGTGELPLAKWDVPEDPNEAMDWSDCSCIKEEGLCESTQTCEWTGIGCEVDPDQLSIDMINTNPLAPAPPVLHVRGLLHSQQIAEAPASDRIDKGQPFLPRERKYRV